MSHFGGVGNGWREWAGSPAGGCNRRRHPASFLPYTSQIVESRSTVRADSLGATDPKRRQARPSVSASTASS